MEENELRRRKLVPSPNTINHQNGHLSPTTEEPVSFFWYVYWCHNSL